MPIIESRETLQTRLAGIIGERADDEALNFIADTLETYDHLYGRSQSVFTQEDIDAAVNTKDEEWRKRYKQSFLEGTGPIDPAPVPPAGGKGNNDIKISDLFG